MAEKPSQATTGEWAAWSKLVRRTAQVGVSGLIGALILGDQNGRQAIWRTGQIVGHAFDRGWTEVQPMLRDLVGYTRQQFDNLRREAMRTIVFVEAIGLAGIVAAASIPSQMTKAIVINIMDAMAFGLIHLFWGTVIVPLVALGVANGYLKGIDDKTLASLRSFWAFLFSGPKVGLPEGLKWVMDLWRWCAMAIFWIVIGSQYLIWVPLHQVPEILVSALPTIYTFALFSLIWPPEVRGKEISWIIWAQIAILADIAFLAVFPGILYRPLVDGNAAALAVMMTILVAEAIGIIYIVFRSRRSAEAEASGANSVYRSPGERLYKQPQPQNITSVVGTVVLICAGILLIVFTINMFNPGLFTINTAIRP